MPVSPLSFTSSESFRNNLMVKNLPPYTVVGNFTPPSGPITYETVLGDSNVIDSPNNLNQTYPDQLYVLNEYGPSGGYNLTIDFNGPPLPVNPNQGPYQPNTSQLVQLNGFYIQNPYIINIYSPQNGYDYVYSVVDATVTGQIHLPYLNSFVSSSYSPYSILTSTNPSGSDGSLSEDSYIAQLGASQLKGLFEERINFEIYQSTVGAVNLAALQDPFEAALLVTGQQPLIYRNWRITVPENPIVAAVDFATRIAGAYWPVSFIPGDYFDENESGNLATNQTSNALSTVNQLTGGLLGPILNLKRNPSQIFLANTGNGQRSALFLNLHYNKYTPNYNSQFGGALGVIQGLVNTAVNAVTNPNGTITSSYYVGSPNAEPSQITSPMNQIPVNSYGQQIPSPVYGPSELSQLYEGNIDSINFGLAGKSSTDGGGIDGQFIWTSPKYKDNAGYKATPGGGNGSKDDEFNQINSQYQSNESTNLNYKEGSILDNTQKLVESGDAVSGANRLKHVGNAINQVSKVFNDGYKEMTKGSQVVSYKDNTTGTEAGIEYCRVFTKDTPYYTYADLQKTDGITTSGRRFTNSVLDNTYNLNIAPLKNPGSTNIVKNEKGDFYAKKYMFSIENLAWRTSSRPGFTYDELPVCEKGPNGGRVMWFPPYNLSFSDSSQANWNPTNFLGRPEPIYTYRDTSRSGTLNWSIIVDSPSVMNVIVNEQLKNTDDERVNSILESFFAGCVKFDIYELAKKFNKIPFTELQQIQETLNNPRLTAEELESLKKQIPADNTKTEGDPAASGADGNIGTTPDTTPDDFEKKYEEFAFYFDNDIPGPHKTGVDKTSENFETIYNQYIGKKGQYESKSKTAFVAGNPETNTNDFFNNVITPNYNEIAGGDTNFIVDAINLIEKGYGPITLTMEGSASAVATNQYNKSLSQRRIDSVRNFFRNKNIGGKSLGKYMEGKDTDMFKVVSAKGFGEDVVIPKMSTKTDMTEGDSPTGSVESGSGSDVNCRELQKSQVQGVPNSVAQIYSVSAMACRRVAIKNVKVVRPEVKPVDAKDEEENNGTLPAPLRPLPTTTVTQKLKEGLSKKVLRALLSECDYFEMIKENEPMIYKTFKDKIKHFNPAFHSMTPEGLNARLTFLNQCVRPGETIPTIDVNGRPKYNDAINTSFGTPPVLVLRVGDFYHTKIIPTSVSFQYEPLIYDINPEGIGVQPMMVKVSMQFHIIGGMGLAKPVEQLQNALSFNYYANTEIYDERAIWTEDTSALDKEVFDAIKASQDIPNPTVTQPQSNDGGNTIGDIKTTIPVTNGEEGELVYQKVMDKLLDTSKAYFTTVVNQLEKIVVQYNYGTLQLINNYIDNRQFTKGTIGGQEGIIYGKPQYEKVVDYIFESCLKDVEIGQDPIVSGLVDENYKPEGTYANNFEIIKQNLTAYINGIKTEYASGIALIVNDIVSAENDLIYEVSRLNAINDKFDGKISGSVIKLYQLSGSTTPGDVSANSPGVANTYDEFVKDYTKLPTALGNFNQSLKDKGIIDVTVIDDNSFTFKKIDNETQTYKDFFFIMARIITNPNKLQEFKTFILTPNIASDEKLVKKFDKVCDKLVKDYSKELEKEELIFTNYKKSSDYKKYSEGLDATLYPKGKVRKLKFSTITDEDKKANRETYLKNIYGTVNYEPKGSDLSTYDCKINI